MGRAIQLLFFLALIGFVGLTGYAYIAPYFGVNFAPEPQDIRQPITLELD
ncbi:MAG: hypothetical protein AAF755_12995 [Pseudomonadota bacterium]